MLVRFLFFLLSVASSPAPALGDDAAVPVASAIDHFCSPTGRIVDRTYLPNGTFVANLKNLTASLLANASASGFSALSIGAPGGGAAYGIVLCRGDFLGAQCVTCLKTGFEQAASYCPGSPDATMYFDQCHLRYSDLDFLAGGAAASNMPERRRPPGGT
ncbi:hypothetical protein U9M48_005291 [Paspalum notatum var. saurae]|uniref:Gnk2-homologous domain-containing protein n=1 Tax=Paspalum notatum var. saurae TaxID=547442 RepID=A0AAQ3PPV8_PASNO